MDGKSLFVGSYNLDPRSTWLNCEQGVLVENAVLASELEALFETQTTGRARLAGDLEDGELALERRRGVVRAAIPKASAWLRFQAWATKVLHLDAQL